MSRFFFPPALRGCRNNSSAWGPRRSCRVRTRTFTAAPLMSVITRRQVDRANWMRPNDLTGTRATRLSGTRSTIDDLTPRHRHQGATTIWMGTLDAIITPSHRSRLPPRPWTTRSVPLWRSEGHTSSRNRDIMWVNLLLYVSNSNQSSFGFRTKSLKFNLTFINLTINNSVDTHVLTFDLGMGFLNHHHYNIFSPMLIRWPS